MRAFVFFILTILLSSNIVIGQESFKEETLVKYTAVKNQGMSGTCWSFATVSFLESELLRQGKGEFDLSEMFFVRKAYEMKAENFIRMHGTANFSQGGQAHDVFNVIDRFGVMTEELYSGMLPEDSVYNHDAVESLLKGMLSYYNGIGKPDKRYKLAINAVLDVYFGVLPLEVTFRSKVYSPIEFNQAITGIKSSDYIEITSFNHLPWYKFVRLEIPDNWCGYSQYFNVPLKDLMSIIDNALKNGYSICWDGDVSELNFKHRLGYARLDNEEQAVTQEVRQNQFDDFSTSDDHLMHIVGISKDEKGNRYYITKNSWGTRSNSYNGLLHMSQKFVMMKTVAIIVHKDALPEEIRKHLQ